MSSVKTKPSETFLHHLRRPPQPLKAALAVVLSLEMGGPALFAQDRPQGGVVRAGDARIIADAASTRIEQQSERAIIDWRSFSIGAGGQVLFQQPSSGSATLNRVTGAQTSLILGRLDANGQVLLINPNGVVFGGGAQVNVGSLVATTSNLTNSNFMAGRLVFDQPGRPGAGIANAGAITAAEGGLVALVAPHVRNDGVLVARLGKVVLGAADAFTVDLYGDALINLALSDVHAGQLRSLNGEPVTSLITQAGTIDVSGGRAVLMTARNAKNVLDSLVNMSGNIKADTAVAQGGRILLLGEGGTVDVSGTMSATGVTGGAIEALGGNVHIRSTANLDASGAAGGGVVHAGGAYQGQGDTFRSSRTTIDAGATLAANATERGNGGEVVVWSDNDTRFAGSVQARGGAAGGDGGRLEVSGKEVLEFLGQADASAPAGRAGSLLLDPAYLNIGAAEASSITRVLRTGTTTNLQADVDINVNSAITGGDRTTGGGLNMTAGNNINVNDFIVTNDGAVNMTATQGTVNIAAGKAVFAGSAPIAVTAGSTLHIGQLITGGSLAIQSIAGGVAIDSALDSHTGPVSIRAAGNVDINQPIVNIVSASGLTVVAGADVNVNQAVATNNGAVSLTATTGAVNVAPDTPMLSGTAAMTLNARGNVTTGPTSAGALTIRSTTGDVAVNGLIDTATGQTRIDAGLDVNINQAIVNGQSGAGLVVNAGRDVNVNAVVDGRGGVAGGALSMTAARNVNANDYVLTNGGAVDLTATSGTATVAPGKGTFSGTAAITIQSAGDLTTGAVSGGSLSATSTGGAVRVNGVIDGSTGRVDLNAATDVAINAPVLNMQSGAALTATAGRDVIVNGQVDGRGGAAGGAVNLTARGDLTVNAAIATRDGAIRLSSTNGAATIANTTGLFAGAGAISLDALRNVSTGTLNGGVMNITSRRGAVSATGPIAGTGGAITIAAAGQVAIANAITNPGTASPLSITAGTNINVNAAVGRSGAGVPSGSVAMTAGQNVNLNNSIVTENGAINLTAAGGAVTTGAGQGLFAGAGNVTVQSGQTLSTGTVSTTGTVAFRSTGGSVNVDTAIPGTTGAVTINAANDVNVNRAIAAPRTDAPLSVTAGHDINVNASIDGRDNVLPGPSGGVTLTAGHDIGLNESIVAANAPISLTAVSGAMMAAPGKGLFSGSGTISVTSGATLNTGITSTTGALNFTSTGGGVNVNTAIGDTTGKVTINADATVNINQPITNLKSGGDLAVIAGADINVLAPIDGRNGVAGGAVTMTAGNNLALTKAIATNNGAVTLTATAGSVTVPTGVETVQGVDNPETPLIDESAPVMEWIVSAGSAPVSLTSGDDFTLASPVKTTGALSIASTNGDVTIAAPITDDTGAVTVTAGDALIVNHQIKSNNQDITLNAGAGGITINTITDYDYLQTSPINPGNADLTLNSGGNVTVLDGRGISSQQTVTIDARGQIIAGSIGTSLFVPPSGAKLRPQVVNLNADGGIVSFSTGYAGQVNATSSGGSINLSVNGPGKLRITTGTPGTTDCPTCDISLSSSSFNATLGPNVVLNAGGSINLPLFSGGSLLDLTARSGDLNLGTGYFANITGRAGRDVNLSGQLYIGALALTAGRDIVATPSSPIHLEGALSMVAYRNLTLFLLETMGSVNLTATTGNITLNNDIGPHITSDGTPGGTLLYAGDPGVASLTMNAPAATAVISMQGARAQGDVLIQTGGSLTATREITSVNGTVTIVTGGAQSLSADPIGYQTAIPCCGFVSPVLTPGPKSPLPTAPGVASNLAAGLPAFAEIPVAAANQNVGAVIRPGVASGGASPGGTGGVNGRPAAGPEVARANESSDPSSTDTASALRAAGDSCGEDGATGDTGLEAVAPTKATDAADQKKPSCPPTGTTGQTAAAVPAAVPAVPGGTAAPALPTASATDAGVE